MSGLPLTQPDFALLGDLINETAMGAALKARLLALLVLLFCFLLYRRKSRPAFIASTLASALALPTLACRGHGTARDGLPRWLAMVAGWNGRTSVRAQLGQSVSVLGGDGI